MGCVVDFLIGGQCKSVILLYRHHLDVFYDYKGTRLFVYISNSYANIYNSDAFLLNVILSPERIIIFRDLFAT